MKEPNNEARPTPKWATGVLLFTTVVAIMFICYLGMYYAATMHDAKVTLFELPWPNIKHTALCFAATVIIFLVVAVWFVVRYEQPGRRRQKATTTALLFGALALFVAIVSSKIYTAQLARQGIGTMQVALDTEYRQEEMRILGSLGVYGGYIQVDGEAQIYVCRQMDTFGPFEYSPLVDTETQQFSAGYEAYSRFDEQDMTKLKAVSVMHCQDGYWLIVKDFVNISDLYIELETLNDLQKYIVQMQYNRHTGEQGDLLLQFERTASDAVQRRR